MRQYKLLQRYLELAIRTMTWVTEAAAEAFIICQQEPQFQAASRLRSRPIYVVGPTRVTLVTLVQ